MTAQITLNLPDEVYHQAELLAQQRHRTVSEILVETLEIFSYQPLNQYQHCLIQK
jgi:predicted transcriptional regulator